MLNATRSWACVTGLAFAQSLALSPATAQTTNSIRPISLQECYDLAVLENLDLKIERLNPALRQYDLNISYSGYDPSLNFSGVHSHAESGGGRDEFNQPYAGSSSSSDNFRSSLGGTLPYGLNYTLNGNLMDTWGERTTSFEASSGNVGINLSQPVLKNFLYDDIRRGVAIARSEIKGSELDLRQQMIDIITSVEKAYNDLIHARENVKVQEEGVRLAEQLLADNRRRVQVGTLSPLDEKQSESETYARQADLSGARRTMSTAQNTLKGLITANYQTLHDTILQPVETLTAVPQKVDVMESWSAGLTTRPDVLQARRALEKQGIELRYAKNQRWPELNVVGSYGYGGSGVLVREMHDAISTITSRDQPAWSVGAVASVPLSNKAARESYKKAKLTSDQLILTLKKQEQSVMIEIDNAITAVRTAQDQIESSRQARIYAEQALDGGQKRLQAGTTTSFEVLGLQRNLITARTTEIGAIKDYNNAQADLFKSEGSTLTRKKIELRVR